MRRKPDSKWAAVRIVLLALLIGAYLFITWQERQEALGAQFSPEDLPAYAGAPYGEVNSNIPYFKEDERTAESFESYTKEGFDIESHRRLAGLYHELTQRGCYCMLTNHNTELIRQLYGQRGYKIDVVSVKRMINSDASNRVGEEVIICNF